MTISMYTASVPVFIRMLTNLAAIVDKAREHAEAKKIDPSVLINYRLYPDMLPLVKQIQIASDNAKGCPSRLAGIEPPKYEDNEKTFADLQARIQKTIDFLKTFKPEQIDGSEERPIVLQMRSGTLNFVGQQYLLNFALPNFLFHTAVAHAILRHCGVEVGKQDYLGRSQ